MFNHQIGAWLTNCQPKSKQAKILLGIGIIVNLFLISYYKYANFILNSINDIFRSQNEIIRYLEHSIANQKKIKQVIFGVGILFYV